MFNEFVNHEAIAQNPVAVLVYLAMGTLSCVVGKYALRYGWRGARWAAGGVRSTLAPADLSARAQAIMEFLKPDAVPGDTWSTGELPLRSVRATYKGKLRIGAPASDEKGFECTIDNRDVLFGLPAREVRAIRSRARALLADLKNRSAAYQVSMALVGPEATRKIQAESQTESAQDVKRDGAPPVYRGQVIDATMKAALDAVRVKMPDFNARLSDLDAPHVGTGGETGYDVYAQVSTGIGYVAIPIMIRTNSYDRNSIKVQGCTLIYAAAKSEPAATCSS